MTKKERWNFFLKIVFQKSWSAKFFPVPQTWRQVSAYGSVGITVPTGRVINVLHLQTSNFCGSMTCPSPSTLSLDEGTQDPDTQTKDSLFGVSEWLLRGYSEQTHANRHSLLPEFLVITKTNHQTFRTTAI